MTTSGAVGVSSQTTITSLSSITDPDGNYRITADINGGTPGVTTFNGTLEAAIDPDTDMPYRISGITKPLFTTLTGTVRNLVMESVNISGNTGNTGAIAAEANGAARIYNVGILSGSVGGTGNTGGLVGLLEGTARVINCYSFATITGGTNVGGIVGNNNATTTAASINTMVMNCMFYGDITGGSTISPVYGGNNIANLQGGLNTFNYYAYDELKTKVISKNKYNSALAVEEKFLNRHEFYRLLLNSNKKLAAFYATGSTVDGGRMLKWVLETADRTIDAPKPYPILKAQGYYPSIINPDFDNAPDSATVGRNHGGKLDKTLSVTISGTKTDGGQTWPTGADITTSSLTLTRTDKDFDRYNYNYDKVQLPYYNDVGTGNYTGNKVVTGWKITAITPVAGDPYTSSNYPTTGIQDYPYHNYADRKSSNKDLYTVSKRVFSQGAYFDVPYGVTSITIEPYWGNAIYVADANYDVVYKNDYTGKQNVTQTGTQAVNNTTKYNGQNIKTSITGLGSGTTVYDNAVVLVGNFHLDGVPSGGTTPFTMMSVDEDNDHEPDYSLIYHHKGRTAIAPIRFDFLDIVGTAQAQKPNDASLICNFTIFKTKGWFETTNTSLFYTSQLEYENLKDVAKSDAPLILLGGVVDQFVSTQSDNVTGKTIYIHVGGNVWIKEFGMGTHSDGSKSTPHVPVSVTGGEFPGFYLTGTYNANAAIREDNAECYISGGYFHEAAGASQEGIKGNVRWQIYNADIDNFYGGGTNDAKPIQGDVMVDIYNSHVTTYCGGPKFGNMQTGKKVTTNAEGCTFGTYFGAGYGGLSYSRKKYYDNTSPNWNTLQGYYTTDRGKYFDGATTNSKNGGGNDAQYGKKGPGVATDFDYEFFVWSSGTTGARLFVKFASFSLAQCNDVESKLKNCTVENNYYGGGNLGKVVGSATSELDGCTVNGNVFGAGYSASLPTLQVRDAGFTTKPNYNSASGMFEPGIFSGTTEYNWKHVDNYPSNGSAGIVGDSVITTIDLKKSNLGSVSGAVTLTIKGNSIIEGNVYGGGDQSYVFNNSTPASASTTINIQGNADVKGNVYGGGNEGNVSGSTTVTMDTALVRGSLFGGGNLATVGHSVQVNMQDGTVQGDIYGGGALANTNIGNVTAGYGTDSETIPNTTTYTTQVNLTGGTVQGDVYGGGLGDLAAVGTDHYDKAAVVYGDITVNLGADANGTTGTATEFVISKYTGEHADVVKSGRIFGANNLNGSPRGNVTVNIYKTVNSESRTPLADLKDTTKTHTYNLAAVYGGGNLADYTTIGKKTSVNILDCDVSIQSVYGGGNAASVPETEVQVDGAYEIEYVFGGGNGKDKYTLNGTTWNTNNGADVHGNTNVLLYGGYIHEAYGGSNEKGTITGNASLSVEDAGGTCPLDVTKLVGAGKNADIDGDAILVLGCMPETKIDEIYGGADNANVNGNVELTITSGTFGNVFGGNNLGGMIKGHIKLNIEETGCRAINIDNLYLGGNQAAYSIYGYYETTQDNKTVYLPRTKAMYEAGTPEAISDGRTIPYDQPELNVISCTSIGNVFGGGYGPTAIMYADPTVNLNMIPGQNAATEHALGSIHNVYGGGEQADVHGNTAVNIGTSASVTLTSGDKQSHNVEGARITGNVYGGGLNAIVDGDATVNIGTVGYTTTGYEGVSIAGDVYGGGEGHTTNVTKATVNLGADGVGNSTVAGDIYGGSAFGTVGTTDVKLYHGTASRNVFGGGKGQLDSDPAKTFAAGITTSATVSLLGATVTQDIYGGCNVNGTAATTTVKLLGGSVRDAFGGGLGENTAVTGNVLVEVGKYDSQANPAISGNATVHDVYGGSAKGKVNNADAENTTTSKTTHTYVNLYAGTVSGDVYGGGLGYIDAGDDRSKDIAALVYGDVSVKLNEHSGTAVVRGSVFGCNNLKGTPKGAVTVDVYGTYDTGTKPTQFADYLNVSDQDLESHDFELEGVFGGGNLAAYEPSDDNITTVTIHGCDDSSIKHVYGGGNAASVPGCAVNIYGAYEIGYVYGGGKGTADAAANVTGNATTTINGGTIYRTFGGSDTNGDITGTSTLTIEESATNTESRCEPKLGDVFSYGNKATMSSPATVAMGCLTNKVGALYGGAMNANINNSITLNVNGGSYAKVFGGNKTGGSINGSITVNIQETGECQVNIDELFGCGNEAPYSVYGTEKINDVWTVKTDGTTRQTDPQINLYSFTNIGAVYGAGLGASAVVWGNPTVNINITKASGYTLTNVYGGGYGADVTGNTTVNIGTVSGATISGDVFGGGYGHETTVSGTATINIGERSGSEGSYTYTDHGASFSNTSNIYGGSALGTVANTEVNLYAGTIAANVFGGGKGQVDAVTPANNISATVTTANVNLCDATVTGNIYGGCNDNGTTTTAIVNLIGGTIGTSGPEADKVFGGGKGHSTTTTTATVNVGSDTSTGTSSIYSNVYGGSALGAVGTAIVNLNHVTTLTGHIFGGGMGEGTADDTKATITTSATVNQNGITLAAGKDIYGGCNVNGTAAATYVYVLGGAVHDVFGGGLGQHTGVTGNVLVEVGHYDSSTDAISGTATVTHDVYGGSAKGAVNSSTANTTTVNLWSGTIEGDVYGGGLGVKSDTPAENILAVVNGNTRVNLNGYDSGTETVISVSKGECVVKGSIFGGNNANGSPAGTAQVHIYKTQDYTGHERTEYINLTSPTPTDHTYELLAVYGGGNQAAFTGTTTSVVIETCDPSIETVYGGGNAADATNTSVLVKGAYEIGTVFGGGNGSGQGNPGANVSGTATTVLNGGRIHDFYGGSNAKGNIGTYSNGIAAGGTAITIDDLNPGDNCSLKLDNIYGAGKSAHVDGNVSMTMGCLSDEFAIQNLYGGAQAANINGDVTLTITSGRFDRVFGGNNASGTIGGDITVNIEETGCKPVIIGQVFGGGNEADFDHNTTVNAKSFTSIGEIYGGGNLANIGGNANVNIITRVSTLGTLGTIGYVFGGGYGAGTNVNGNVEVIIGSTSDESISPVITNDVYGGSALGTVNGTTAADTYHTYVTLNSGTVTGSVYGGGLGDNDHSATVNAPVTVTVNGGQAANVFGANNVKGAPQRAVSVNIDGGNIDNVYGGGNQAPYSGNPSVTMTAGTAENVFGGGLGSSATVTGSPSVTISGGTISTNVYGGGSEAKVVGSTNVSITGGMVNKDVFGGGNLAIVTQNVIVSISGGIVLQDVYGGGALANTNTDNWTTGEQANAVTYVPVTGLTIDTTPVAGYYLEGANSTYELITSDAKAQSGTTYYRKMVAGTWATGKNDPITGTSYKTTVSLTGGRVGNVYGGGLGSTSVAANVYGDVTVDINNEPDPINDPIDGVVFTQETQTISFGDKTYPVPTTGSIFGCNNLNGTPTGNVTVHIYSTRQVDENFNIIPGHGASDRKYGYDIAAVYGGGNQADYLPADGKETQVIIDGCGETSIEKIYGGGNSAAVPTTNVTINGSFDIGNAFGGGNGGSLIRKNNQWQQNGGAIVIGAARIACKGGKIGQIFGGSDQKGTCGSVSISKTQESGCPLIITKLYGAGNEADVPGDVNTILSACTGNEIEYVYGGSYNANIGGNVTLTITSGIFKNVYGGNDSKGSIGGDITVNIEETDECKPIIIQNLLGGGNEAPYPGTKRDGTEITTPGTITVNVKSATRIDNVFGGSYKAEVLGDTKVNINMIKGNQSGQNVELPSDYSNIGSSIPNISNINTTYVDITDQLSMGTSLVAGYYVLSGGNYVATSDGKAVDGVTYYEKRVTGTISDEIGTIGNVFGGGNLGLVTGDAIVNIGTSKTVEIMRRNAYGQILDSNGQVVSFENGDNITANIAYDTRKVLGAHITGNVYGGGNDADIWNNTYVNICTEDVNGVLTPVDLKTNNTNYEGVWIKGSVYGGGNMGSVGKYNYINNAKPTTLTSGGTSNVTILGDAEIGPDDMRMPQDFGHVFGASKGIVRAPSLDTEAKKADYMAYVYNTLVTIGDHAFVKGSVYGGSENGHVLHDTHVIIKENCQIGNGWNPNLNDGAGGGVNRPYTAQEWASNSLYECASWEYSGTHDPYDIYKDSDGDGTPDPATDGHTFYGNVFGGGSGYYPYAKNPNISEIKAKDSHYADGLWLSKAGIVEGNTLVEITGGHVLTSVYGGNEQTDVLGSCTVNISGGTVGVPRTLEQMKAHPVTCYVFGAGKGDQRINFNTWTNVGSTIVNITDSARIYGSVFGGGEDGHVLGDAVTTIGRTDADNSKIRIGTTGTSSVDGNIFGGGRGFSGQALTAGVVCGNVELTINGGTILGSVFGGGRLASVGTGLVHPETGVTVDANGNVTRITDITPNAAYGTLLDDDITNTYGNITINISGGTIGATDNSGNLASSEFTIGDVFAGGKGSIENPELGLVKNTTLTISGGTVNHNVYGGGEIGSVGKITNFKNLDSKSGGSYIYRHDDEENSNPTSNGAQYGFGLSWPYMFEYPTTTVAGKTVNTTGLAQVTIQGTAVIKGDVYGGSQGKLLLDWDNIDLSTVSGSTNKDKIIKVQNDYRYYQEKFANVRQTSVTINLSTTLASASGSGERIVGSVYGGAENGHVYDDASVTINKGLIGGHVFGGGKGDGRFQAYLLDPIAGSNQGNLKSEKENVYSWTAGKVYGNTYVTMNDGWVIRNVYGGGDLGSVGKGNYAGGQDDYSKDGYGELPPRGNQALWTGSDTPGTYPYYFFTSGITNVVINGGKIGIQDALDTDPVFNTTFPTGNVFGSGRGLSAINVGRLSPRYRYVPEFYLGYVNQANVTIGSSTGTGSGPILYGSVYGGGQDGHVRRSTQVNVYKGQIGQVYNGSGNLEDAQWMGRGNVYGAGAGMGKYYDLLDSNKEKYNFSSGSVTCATVVNIYGGTIHQNIYGGGALASVGPPKTTQPKLEDKTAQDSKMSVSYTQVNIFNGAVIGDSVSYGNDYGGNVYGASRGNDHLNYNGVDSTTYATDIWAEVNVSGGHIIGNVFGGGEIGQVSMGVDVNISGGSIDHDVYGGGALASTNTWSTTDSESGHKSFPTTTVNLTGGTMNDVYGGGLGSLTVNGAEITSKKKPLSGNVIVNLNKNVANNAKGAVLRHLYGANNLNGSPQGTIRVNVYATQNAVKDSITQDKDESHYHTGYEETGVASTYDVFAVYGGGNLAPYEPANNDATLVTIDGCYKVSIKQVYGGGNAASVPATHVKVLGTYEIEELFGGGNGKDPYTLEGNTYHNPGANVGYYNYTDFVQEGSSNTYNPVDKPGATTKDGRADFKYGSGVATTEIRGGKIHYVYGGSNEKGNISTTALSVYENAIEDCPIDVDETYGGGKNAPMDGTIELTLDCVKDMDMIFGGARNADIFSDVTLNITNGKYNKVFGGNNTSGALYGSITVNIKEEGCQPIEIEELYGGGYLAPYSIYGYKKDANDSIIPLQQGDEGAQATPFKDPRINIISATRIDNIYGGGYKAKMIGSPYINVNMEDGRMLVYKVTTGDQTQYLDVKLNEYDPATLKPEQVDDETKYYTPLSLGTIGNIYGGGYEADVEGDTHIEIGTGRWLTSWNETDGQPEYTATPGNRKAAVITGDVYGGGNKADVTKNTWINIEGGIIMHNVYGGGKEGSVGTLVNNAVEHKDQEDGTNNTDLKYSFYEFGLSWPVKLEYVPNTGNTNITITGTARIGTSGDDNGDVFGAGKGKIKIDWEKLKQNTSEWNAAGSSEAERMLYYQNKYRYEEAYQTNVNSTNVSINLPLQDNIDDLITVQQVWDDDDSKYKYKYVVKGFTYNMDESDTVNHGSFTVDTDTVIPCITGSVYGGAEDGHVIGNTSVTLTNGLIGHSIYGGGKGKGKYMGVLYDINEFDSEHADVHKFKNYATLNNYADEDDQYKEPYDGMGVLSEKIYSLTAGKVYGNTSIIMNGGHVMRNIYGGGNLGSVGKGNYSGGTDDYALVGYGEMPSKVTDGDNVNLNLWTGAETEGTFAYYFKNSGNTYVEINAGTVGFVPINLTNRTSLDNDEFILTLRGIAQKDDMPTGNVFGGCRGKAAPNGQVSPRFQYIPEFFLGYVNETEVKIGTPSSTPVILGSVYGGGQDGHVRRDAKVTINNATIGIPYNQDNIDLLGGLIVQDKNDQNIDNIHWRRRGTVYGAGSGIGEYSMWVKDGNGGYKKDKGYNYSSGSVTRKTTVDIKSGAHIYENVYGGGAIASVGPPPLGEGKADYTVFTDGSGNPLYGTEVNISSGALIGVVGQSNYGGNVYGASRGSEVLYSAAESSRFATDPYANVNITGGTIANNVFGGGQMGSVSNNTDVQVTGAAISSLTIGHDLFGGGEHADVKGNTNVNVTGGLIKHNVYGGGNEGSVGTWDVIAKHDSVNAADAKGAVHDFGLSWPYELKYKAGTGLAKIRISGQTRIGLDGDDDGDVFGASKGRAADRYAEALLYNVNISDIIINLPSFAVDPDIDSIISVKDVVDSETQKTEKKLYIDDAVPAVTGSVYGGGEDGHVYGNTNVTLKAGLVGHSIYGGGKGKGQYDGQLRDYHNRVDGVGELYNTKVYSLVAGRVYGNTNVTMEDGYVMRSIYGGGNLGSVGIGNYAGGSDDYSPDGYGELPPASDLSLWTNTDFLKSGVATVKIEKGTIGYICKESGMSSLNKKSGLPTGNVFGGCRGMSAPNYNDISPRYEYFPEFFFGYVNDARVIIGTASGGPTILGSVYGGGQDGHVRRDAIVTINNGEIGVEYTDEKANYLGSANINHMQWRGRGNVYAAGSGTGEFEHTWVNAQNDTVTETGYNYASGSVTGVAKVQINNGTIYQNVYGGGSLASIGPPPVPPDRMYAENKAQEVVNQTTGKVEFEPISTNGKKSYTASIVTVSGGQVGQATNYAVGYGGNVYGASRGDYDGSLHLTDPSRSASTVWTQVKINGTAHILGNVFGGGENGTVKRDTYVEIGGIAQPTPQPAPQPTQPAPSRQTAPNTQTEPTAQPDSNIRTNAATESLRTNTVNFRRE